MSEDLHMPPVPPEKRGVKLTSNPLGTCPTTLREKYARMAIKASEGKRAAAITLKCMECCCWNAGEVRRCEITDCPLWEVRARWLK